MTMTARDLIFKTLVDRGCQLEGQTRVWNLADSKLWYLTSAQAKAFLALTKNSRYKTSIMDSELFLLKKHSGFLAQHLSSTTLNLVDLGCGNGQKAALLVQTLPRSLHWRYFPVDISRYLVRQASLKMIQLGVRTVKLPPIDFQNLQTSPFLKALNSHPSLFLILGNTLGNFDNDSLLAFLAKIMRPGSGLIVGNGLNSGHNSRQLLKSYRHPQIEHWLVQLLLLLGLNRQDLTYGVRFINSRIEEYFAFKKQLFSAV